jgi:hypothetical protein
MVKFAIALILCLSYSQVQAGGHGGGGGDAPVNLQLPDLVIPVIQREDVQAYYSLSLSIEAKDETKRPILAEFSHRIKDAIISDLYVILPLIWSKDDQPNLDKLKKRLEMVAQKATPENTIGPITINSFQLTDAKKQGLDVDQPKK